MIAQALDQAYSRRAHQVVVVDDQDRLAATWRKFHNLHLSRRGARTASSLTIRWQDRLLHESVLGTARLRIICRNNVSVNRLHANLAIHCGESVAGEIYRARLETAVLDDPGANRLRIRAD